MIDLSDKSDLLNYLKLHNLWAKKGLSQNFLVDKDSLDKIVGAADLKKDDLVIEIGPGTGILTKELIKHAGEVIAVEMDKQLFELLNQTSIPPRRDKDQNEKSKLKIINADILKLNLNEIIGSKKYKVVANIPYHITSKILELFLSRENKPELMVLLVQKEVAERICAMPGQMSTLAISVQLYSKPEIIEIVPKESFFPSPKVDSAILRIRTRVKGQESKVDEKLFFRAVHIGFASRRKTLINNLSAGLQIDKKAASDIIKSIGLNETARAQELSISEWKKISQIIR